MTDSTRAADEKFVRLRDVFPRGERARHLLVSHFLCPLVEFEFMVKGLVYQWNFLHHFRGKL